MKGDLSQVLLALKNIIDRQDQIPRVAFKEVAQMIGASSGHQLRKEPEAGLQKSVMAQQEVETEGFVPPPPKAGASHTLQIPTNNADNYLDMQYGGHDPEDANQAPLKTTGTYDVDNPLVINQYKALEEILKAVEGFDAFEVDTLKMGLVLDVVIPPKFKVPV